MVDSDDDDAFPSFDAPPAPAADAAVVAPVAPDGSVRDVTWSVDAPGARLHFQILALRDQLYLSRARRGRPLARGDEHGARDAAVPGSARRHRAHPRERRRGQASAAAAADRASDQTAARFAKRTRRSSSPPSASPPDGRTSAFAEKQLADKIDELGM